MRTEKSAHGLVVFDLDGTLIRGSTVCELLAEPLGKLSRMQQFEKLKTEDEITSARIEMASWYADIPLTRLIESLEAARLAPGTLVGEEATGLPETITVAPTGDILSVAKLIVKKLMIS
jgi:FMN phosphatase YigB (HAD superfamily)